MAVESHRQGPRSRGPRSRRAASPRARLKWTKWVGRKTRQSTTPALLPALRRQRIGAPKARFHDCAASKLRRRCDFSNCGRRKAVKPVKPMSRSCCAHRLHRLPVGVGVNCPASRGTLQRAWPPRSACRECACESSDTSTCAHCATRAGIGRSGRSGDSCIERLLEGWSVTVNEARPREDRGGGSGRG